MSLVLTIFPTMHFSVDQDPLNSGDDVIEQDIPDLFDTDNVIVCQYDKVRTFWSFSSLTNGQRWTLFKVYRFHFVPADSPQ